MTKISFFSIVENRTEDSFKTHFHNKTFSDATSQAGFFGKIGYGLAYAGLYIGKTFSTPLYIRNTKKDTPNANTIHQSQNQTGSEEIEMQTVETTPTTNKTQITQENIQEIIKELDNIKTYFNEVTRYNNYITNIGTTVKAIDSAEEYLKKGDIEGCYQQFDVAISALKKLPQKENNMPSLFANTIRCLNTIKSQLTYTDPAHLNKQYKQVQN